MPEGEQRFQKQCLAVSEDGINFVKVEKNPIIEVPEDVDMSVADFRDPKVWKHGKKFYAVVGAKTADGAHGQILLFESSNLKNWTFKNISARAEGNQGYMWECPNFAQIGRKDVLIISPQGIEPEGPRFLNPYDVIYTIGKLDYDTGIFEHGDFDMLDYGFDFYAPQVTKIPDGRTILIGWLQMWFRPQPEQADGWAGLMTVPRELKIVGDKIFTPPIDELKNLRTSKRTFKNLSLEGATAVDFEGSDSLELNLTVDLSKSKKFSIGIRKTARIFFDANIMLLKFIRDAAGNEQLAGEREVQLSPANELNLQIYIDRSSVEIFANGGERVLSSRIYPEEDAKEITFIPEENSFEIEEVTFYQLAQSVPNPKM